MEKDEKFFMLLSKNMRQYDGAFTWFSTAVSIPQCGITVPLWVLGEAHFKARR